MKAHYEQTEITQIIDHTSTRFLLELTINQIRTYVALCRARTQEGAADLLRADPSSVRTIRRKFDDEMKSSLGECPFTPVEHRGSPFELTASGRVLKKHAEQILRQVFALNQELAQPRPLRLALANYQTEIPIIHKILKEATAELANPIVLTQVASHDKESVLKRNLVDFVFAGMLSEDGEPQRMDKSIKFQPLLTARVGLLANYRMTRVGEPKGLLIREREYLLPPTRGVFVDILNKLLTPHEIQDLPGVRTYNVPFALDVLRFGLLPKACVIVDEVLAKIIRQTRRSPKPLSFVPFEIGLAIQTGVFQLKHSRKKIEPDDHWARSSIQDHPFRRFEDIVAKYASRRRSPSN